MIAQGKGQARHQQQSTLLRQGAQLAWTGWTVDTNRELLFQRATQFALRRNYASGTHPDREGLAGPSQHLKPRACNREICDERAEVNCNLTVGREAND